MGKAPVLLEGRRAYERSMVQRNKPTLPAGRTDHHTWFSSLVHAAGSSRLIICGLASTFSPIMKFLPWTWCGLRANKTVTDSSASLAGSTHRTLSRLLRNFGVKRGAELINLPDSCSIPLCSPTSDEADSVEGLICKLSTFAMFSNRLALNCRPREERPYLDGSQIVSGHHSVGTSDRSLTAFTSTICIAKLNKRILRFVQSLLKGVVDDWSEETQRTGGDSANSLVMRGEKRPEDITRIGAKRDLNIWLPTNMSFSLHLEKLAQKEFVVLRMIRHTSSRITRTDFQILHVACVRPLFEYANPVVYSGCTKDVIFIERVQEAATKMIAGLKSVDYETRP
ncbi:hypothetical protein CLF_110059 [Clonorchis sinensis]|uniref:Uncharacterized protein n=1 Tax=Clonorchis sinensis TaxID=79923 RepID=H2KSR9_CLOSI|nr:hypothetical protein CLF_110059 [Clonorchis sinensis]